jgi:RNA polymerase sigma-70 factor, ECF subfamily
MSRQGLQSPPEDAAFAALWEGHAPSVRRHLVRLGVQPADVDDLVQEVFLLAHEKRALLAAVQLVDPWLREVCRRVAAGHRRLAHRRHEVAFGEPPELASEAAAMESELQRGQEEERLLHALGRLDEESRDLVALHRLGPLPLVDVATLVDADRKTVRKRLMTALRRLTHLLGSNDGVQDTDSSATDNVQPALSVGQVPDHAPLEVLAEHPAVQVGRVGAVVIAVWPGRPTLETLELLDAQLAASIELHKSGIAYFAVVEATTAPPSYEARQKIVAMLKDHATDFFAHATALEGGAAWIARPVMTALTLLARPPFVTQFFNGAPSAARWLVENHGATCRASAASILAAVEGLRQLQRPEWHGTGPPSPQ